jgi:AcrR family transcriptional regulator
MNNQALKRKRIMRYFIDATGAIIEEEGLEGVTIRKVADAAGYNSATLYNYFNNIDHLIFYASIKYLSDYARALPEYIKDAEDSYDRYLRIWQCFCDYSFRNPKIYHLVFLGAFGNTYPDVIKEYYSIYPDYLSQIPAELTSMLMENDLYERNLSLLQTCAAEGLLRKADLVELNDMTMLIYQGLLLRAVNAASDSADSAVMAQLATGYIKRLTDFYRRRRK